MLFGEAGVLALETEVLMIETASQPGVLAKIAERLAEVEVNIEYAYLAGGREVEKGSDRSAAVGWWKKRSVP